MTSQAQADANRQNPRKLSPDHPRQRPRQDRRTRSKPSKAALLLDNQPANATSVVLGGTLIASWRGKWVRLVGRKRFRFLWVGPPKWVRLVFFAWHAPPAPPSLHPKPVTPMETQPLASPQKTCAKSRRRQISPGTPSTNGRASAGPTILPTPWPPPAG